MKFKKFILSAHAQNPHLLLVGNPVSHSLSPLMHNTAAEFHGLPLEYHAVQLSPGELSTFTSHLNSDHLEGVNVTIPYKQELMSVVDRYSSECQTIGALNTIKKTGGRLVGHNTDVFGFKKPLEPHFEELEGARAVVFGTGGAARAVTAALSDLHIEEILLVSRAPQKRGNAAWPENTRILSYDAWPAFADDVSIMVNTTPLGMHPKIDESPVKMHQKELLAHTICYDIVYKPRRTKFLQLANEAGARTIGGLEMLIHQGSRSFELWTGNTFPIDLVRRKLMNALKDEN